MTDNTPVRLLVGLGNPGTEYANTRHNAGIWFIDRLLALYGGAETLKPEAKFQGLCAQISVAHNPVRILVPTTFMNNSGRSVAAMANFYKIEPQSILIAHDELDLDPGTVRLKVGGGHGGHNGLRDIISSLGNQKQFGRLRIGIGHPGNAKQVSNFVLRAAPSAEQSRIEASIDEAARHAGDIVKGNWQQVMNSLHSFTAE